VISLLSRKIFSSSYQLPEKSREYVHIHVEVKISHKSLAVSNTPLGVKRPHQESSHEINAKQIKANQEVKSICHLIGYLNRSTDSCDQKGNKGEEKRSKFVAAADGGANSKERMAGGYSNQFRRKVLKQSILAGKRQGSITSSIFAGTPLDMPCKPGASIRATLAA